MSILSPRPLTAKELLERGIGTDVQELKAWTESGAYSVIEMTRNPDGIVVSATVEWPDGSPGTFTATQINAQHTAIDAYHVTHDVSERRVRQPTVTRDGNGAVTVKPVLVVEDIP